MLDTNYFQVLSFIWAMLAILSRIAMVIMGEKWKKWEMGSFYQSKRPVYILVIGVLGYILVIATWIMVAISDISHSWILAAIISITVIKVSMLLFAYDKFRLFAKQTLNNPKKMLQLNVAVIFVALLLVSMGIFVY